MRRAIVIAVVLTGVLVGAACPSGASGNGWSPVGAMSVARWQHAAALLPDGTVLVAGGDFLCCSDALASAEIYLPGSQTFTPTGAMTNARSSYTLTPLGNGEVLAA